MNRDAARKSIFLICLMVLLLIGFAPQSCAWNNGPYSTDPHNPNYGTHDYLFEHALNMLPATERNALIHNLSLALYGTEMPDKEDEIGDWRTHHIYFNSAGELTDNSAAVRAREEYELALEYLRNNDRVNADKHIGAMSHYITDVSVFGHVMHSSTPWGQEEHHSDYEWYVQGKTTSYTSHEFDQYIVYDGSLTELSAYDAAVNLARDVTFGTDGVKNCVWMDTNYNWNNPVFKDSCGNSINLAVNYLADVLHTLYLDLIRPPASFELSNLRISRTEVSAGEMISIYVDLRNTGGLQGTYTVELKINGITESAKSVTLAGGTSQTVMFTVTKGTAGSYTVGIGNLTKNFIVTEQRAVGVEQPERLIPWIMAGIVVAVAGASVATIVNKRRCGRWYLYQNSRRYGPVNTKRLHKWIDEGRVKKDTLVWRKGMEGWRKIEETEPFKSHSR